MVITIVPPLSKNPHPRIQKPLFSVRRSPGSKDGEENDEEGVEDPRAVGLLEAGEHLVGEHVAH